MSSLKVSNLQHASAASAAIVLASDSTATLNGLAYPTSGSLSGRNRIINGDMRIDQRNAGASVTATAGGLTYCVDRFFVYATGAAVTAQRVTGTNTSTPYAFKVTGASGSTQVNIGQRIENLNTLDLNNSQITVSCKIYASTTISNVSIGLFYCSSDNTGYGTTTDSQAITVTSGLNTITKTFTLSSVASRGFEVAVVFASGLGSGVSVEVSNLQVETGSVATPFERRSYGQELALCQRYFENMRMKDYNFVGQVFTSSEVCVPLRWTVVKRTTPTVTLPPTGTGVGQIACVGSNGSYPTTIGTHSVIVKTESHAEFNTSGYGGLTAGHASFLYASGSPNIQVSAEL